MRENLALRWRNFVPLSRLTGDDRSELPLLADFCLSRLNGAVLAGTAKVASICSTRVTGYTRAGRLNGKIESPRDSCTLGYPTEFMANP